jgi:CubicO group peptidase (beta-lactamase class C family)
MKELVTLLVAVNFTLFSHAQPLYFPPVSGNTWDTISPRSLNWCQNRIDSLYYYLEINNTKAFILLKDGKIVLEKYFGTHTQSSPWQWASAGKTITAFMTGIAQQERYLSLADPTSVYLGKGWTACTPAQEEKITIRHQLTMTSGLDDGVPDNFCTLDTCLIYKADAGKRWAYHNGPYTLLDKVIESATKTTLNAYTTQKLKNPTGMTGSFIPVGYNNVFFSNARSMARFGLLILNKGNWNGNQIMTDTAFFNQMVSPSQTLNQSYGYLWWLNGKASYMLPGSQFVFKGFLNPNAPSTMFVAMGKDGQFLNIVPDKNLVWLRMGNSPDGLPVPFLMNDKIWEFVGNLQCNTTSLNEPEYPENQLRIFPNPGYDLLNIESDRPILKVEIYDINGKLMKTERVQSTKLFISISELPGGLFLIKAAFADGTSWTGRLLKNASRE